MAKRVSNEKLNEYTRNCRQRKEMGPEEKEAARRAKNAEKSRRYWERLKERETEAEKAARLAKHAQRNRKSRELKKQREAAIAIQHQQEQQNSTLLSQGDDNYDSNTTISNRASVPASVQPSDTSDNDNDDARHKHLVELGFNTMMINASLLEKSVAGQQQVDSEKFAAILAENRYCFDMIFNEIVGNGKSGGTNNDEVGSDGGNEGNDDNDGVLSNNENRVPNNTCNKNGNAVSDNDGGKGEEDDIVLV